MIYTIAVHSIPECCFEFCFYSDSGGCLLQGLVFIDGQKVPNAFYTENPLLQPHPSNWRGDPKDIFFWSISLLIRHL